MQLDFAYLDGNPYKNNMERDSFMTLYPGHSSRRLFGMTTDIKDTMGTEAFKDHCIFIRIFEPHDNEGK